MTELMESMHFVKGLDPVANAFAGTKNSDIVSMRDYGRVLFVIHMGVGTTGTSVYTVESSDDVSGSNVTAIPFWSREITTGDTEGAFTRRAAAGFTSTAGSSKIILIEADAKDLPAGEPFVRLTAVESAASAVLAGTLIILGGKPSRYLGAIKATAIV